MNSIRDNIVELKNELPSTVKLVAVSKFKPASDIFCAYEAGQRAFAESRPQEFVAKAASLPSDIEWHFIGHLQTNKVKMIMPYVSLIQSVDSLHLLDAISNAAVACGRCVDCLLEVHIAHEESKQGFYPSELEDVLCRIGDWPGVRFRGLMGMASFSDDEGLISDEFRFLKSMFDKYSGVLPGFDTLSMGMSGDWRLAVSQGSNMVRIGSAIFGER